ncbi:MAG TPA: 5-methyltetrahydropteroyltriglutamate--homocysteine S-methyltransferase [Bacteroidales bacterium]|nr:5-methyltetrahydropteroyltriglutamate--homocysteine S-methyltransferase [Bacteroidales bacterium]
MLINNLGYPRIGNNRELKKASEDFWQGKITDNELELVGKEIRKNNWFLQKSLGVDLIPSNDFSFYDHVLDMTLCLGAIPDRYLCLKKYLKNEPNEFYFALARGYQKEGFDIPAMEMTKWFDTNYHYIVPEFSKSQHFVFNSKKPVNEFVEAKAFGITTKPVLIGPVSYLMLGKSRQKDTDSLDLIADLLPVYFDIIHELASAGASWIQLDEPFLALDLSQKAKDYFKTVYKDIRNKFPGTKILVATYFEGLRDNETLAAELPVDAIHLDLVRSPRQLERFMKIVPSDMMLSLGIIDGRNIWKNDYRTSLELIKSAHKVIGNERIMIAPSCSLIHSPVDLEPEKNGPLLDELLQWMAFSRQKIEEARDLKELAMNGSGRESEKLLSDNQESLLSRKKSSLIHNEIVKERLSFIGDIEKNSRSDFHQRKLKQRKKINLPLFPSTTIGSFPQTAEVRGWRSKLRRGEITKDFYIELVRSEIEKAIKWQEEIGLDVLVHGEFERNDMVEYFGELLQGFAFTKNGWIQSYGSRYVKPPIIYGDIQRNVPMTVDWIKYAQSLTDKPVKGMLTGPVTILQWSFVRDDQPISETCFQIALAVRDEVQDLETAGIKIIQIDEPALREGLPLRKSEWKEYLDWAVKAFKLASTGVHDETQIHTHMCYSEFNDIIEHIAALDADVITIECSRSQMELLDAFAVFNYPNDIGPGVYDIHSPRIPGEPEISHLLEKASEVIPAGQLWVNPDCGLKTRGWSETREAITNMVVAARQMRMGVLVK